MKRNVEKLVRSLDPELAYLMLLTDEGVKPISRCEKPFGGWEVRVSETLGLEPKVIERKLEAGGVTRELIFGRNRAYLEIYQRRFDGTPIGHSTEMERLEGFLFGYPCCCIEAFIRKGYHPNGLPEEDQQLLFHWVCKGCRVTPLLLPEYRRIWRECESLFSHHLSKPFLGRFAGGIAAAVAACLTLSCSPSPTGTHTAFQTNPHFARVTVGHDLDSDGLSDTEESLLKGELGLNCDLRDPDTDADGILDGVQLAYSIAEGINGLDTTESKTHPYKIEHWTKGQSRCPVCGIAVNMGSITIVNPVKNIQEELSFLDLHYLEYGSFRAGSYAEGRLNPLRLSEAVGLFPISNSVPQRR